MKTASDLWIDAGYLKNVIRAADFIDNENSCGNNRDLNAIVTGLIHVAGRLAEELDDDLSRLAG